VLNLSLSLSMDDNGCSPFSHLSHPNLTLTLVMARYSHKGHDTIRYDITQNIAIRYYTIRSESASPYVRTASKQATAHNTGAASFCLSTLSPLQVPGYWPSGEATLMGDRRGDRRRAGGRCSLKSRVIQQGFCEYWMPNNSNIWRPHGRRAVARLKYLVIVQSLNT